MELEPKCQECQNSVDEWQDFKENIETITDLSKRGNNFSARVVNLDSPCNWMYQFSVTEMIDFQKQDSDLKILYQWLEQEKLPSRDEVAQFSPAVRNFWLNWDSITLKDGILYRKLTLADKKEVQQLLVPKILRQNILQMCHDDLFLAHQGVNKTIHKVKNHFYWYRMGEDIKMSCQTVCSACNKWKKQTKSPRAKLCDYRVGYPLDRIGIDVIGPLP